jgi:alginate O-acetyltransferase complex protein AlgF
MKRFLLVALHSLPMVLVLLGPIRAYAQDGNAALYDAVAPAGSAYLRVLNLSPDAAELIVSGKTAAQKINGGQLGNYLFVAPGAHKVTVNQSSLELNLPAKSALSLVFDGNSLLQIADNYVEDTKKAQIAFYNLTDQPLTLKTLDGKHAIVDSVTPNQSGTRMVNEIKIGFAAYAGDRNVAQFSELFLKKGRSYSYVVIAQGSGYRTIGLMNGLDSIK